MVKCKCAPVTVLPDDVSQLAPRGHPLSKRPLFHPQQLLSEEPREGGVVEREGGGLPVTSFRIAPIVTDAINRNLHSSQCDGVGTRHLRFVPENCSAEEPSVVQKCKDKRSLHCFSSAFFSFFFLINK